MHPSGGFLPNDVWAENITCTIISMIFCLLIKSLLLGSLRAVVGQYDFYVKHCWGSRTCWVDRVADRPDTIYSFGLVSVQP
ncbi:MAG: hypothetical protein Ct9H300mP28_35400 [Pseudomonadota bacterium]|nr:MAG: hypothetical protein Ct9H300mP28_35400 [Pseudomonadota bacterium]